MQTKNKKQEKEPKGTSKGTSGEATMESSQLMKLFEKELKDIYWAEKALLKAIPKMIKNATNEDLIAALENHLTETEEQIERLEEVFESLGKKAVAKKCEAMDGLIREAQEIMKDCEPGPMRDAGIIAAAQKIEHYEIASYGTLCAFAETLELEDASGPLMETLEEEKTADETLTEVALTAINVQAAQEDDDEEHDEEDDQDDEDHRTEDSKSNTSGTSAGQTRNKYIEM